MTAEGLRIELMESAKGTFFELGSSTPTPALRSLLQVLAMNLGQLPNKISIEGHTDSMAYSQARAYDNWDLSTNRANEARRLMEAEGIRSDQIAQVRGLADTQPRLPQNPQDPSNRRITLIIQYQVANGSEVALPGSVTNQNADNPANKAATQPAPAASAPAQGRAGQ
jgi:chemotaxis protein MotB